MAVMRYAGTVALAGLVAAQQYYPDVHWIAIAIVVLGVLGYHVVETGRQQEPPKQ
jgi:threonine/homoserine efflux transporter RhtA